MDDLSKTLKTSRILDEWSLTNYLMHADNLVVLLTFSAGLQQLLRVDPTKSAAMITSAKQDWNQIFFPHKNLSVITKVRDDDDDDDRRYQICL